ncbi:hypothetical protein [Microcoleus phage My-WqHQDG]|nr:hypothetical protein [Microcoleus phage My-WqHQDG]
MSNEVAESLVEWRGRLKAYLLSKSLLGVPTVTTLLEDMDDIIKVLDVPDIGGLTIKDVHPIDKLGCGLAVLSMYCDGMDITSIAKVLHTQTGVAVSSIEVQKWIDSYEDSGVVRRNSMTNLSIFDTKNRMEDILLMLQRVMAQVEVADESEFSRAKTTRYEVQLAALGQIRSAVKDARQVVEALHQMNTYRELADIILQEMAMESPSLQQRVLRRLKEKGAVIKAILPSS